MSDRLQPAELIPFRSDGDALDEDAKIVLDFNPETLTIKVQSGEAADRGRRGRQQVQHVGRSTATLSFDATFDTTRPSGDQPTQPVEAERLDVRRKTKQIADLLQVEDKDEEPSPRRVQFHWGSIRFNGIIKSYSETLDFFSPEGVPLRAKVSISIDEQDFRYEVDAEAKARARQRPAGIDDLNQVAANNDLDSLFDATGGAGFGFDASLDLGLEADVRAEFGASFEASFEAGFDVDLGLGVDLGVSAGAGIDLSAGAAFDLFGEAALAADLGAGVDLGGVLGAKPRAGGAGAGQPASVWAPDGPAPGTRSAALAAHVTAARATGGSEPDAGGTAGSFKALGGEAAPGEPDGREQVMPQMPVPGVGVRPPRTPVPVRGSPPLVASRFGPPPGTGVFSRSPVTVARPVLEPDRPSWERLPPAPETAAAGSGRSGLCCVPAQRSTKPW